jgi:hypothetical protein
MVERREGLSRGYNQHVEVSEVIGNRVFIPEVVDALETQQ